MSSYLNPTCQNCHLVPCTSCNSSSQVQQWSEYPRLQRGSYGGARLKPIKNELGEIQELEWEPLIKQSQDLRISTTKRGIQSLTCSASILYSSESEYLDLIGDPITSSTLTDAQLLASLHEFSPSATTPPLHPTIFLNTHLASHPPLKKSRIANEFNQSDYDRGNCLATCKIRGQGQGQEGQVAVWRMGDEKFKRPTAVGLGIIATRNESSSTTRKGKQKAIDQDSMDVDDNEQEHDIAAEPGGGRRRRKRTNSLPFLQAHTHPIFTHHTPIQQLRLTSLPTSTASSFLLGVRSLTSLDLIDLSLATPFDPGKQTSCSLLESYTIPKSTIADFTLSSATTLAGEGLIVDIKGNLFGFNAISSSSKGELCKLRKGIKNNDKSYESGFARVQYHAQRGGNLQSQVIVALQDQVLLYDLRSSNSSIELIGQETLSRYSPLSSSRSSATSSLITSLLERRSSSSSSSSPWLHTVCTTRDLIWIDQRMVKQGGVGRGGGGGEVLRWEHERVGIEGKGVDTTLTITELPNEFEGNADEEEEEEEGEEVQRIALSSRLNNKLTIYTMGISSSSSSQQQLEQPRSLLDPYDLLPSPLPSCSFPPPDVNGRAVVDGSKFRRVGLSFSTVSDSSSEEEEEEEEEDEDEEHGPDREIGEEEEEEVEQEEAITEEENKRRLLLTEMVKEARIEEKRRTKKKRLRLLEVGMDGQLFEREIDLFKRVDQEAKEGAQEGKVVPVVESEREKLVELREFETVRLDMTAARETLRQEQLVGRDGDCVRDGKIAVEMLKNTVEEAREIEGDVGALTAFELLYLGQAAEPVQVEGPDSDEEEQDAQRDEQPSPNSTRVDTLPRASTYITPREDPLLMKFETQRFSLLDSLVSSFSTSAASSLHPFNVSTNTRFNTFSPFPFSLLLLPPQQSPISQRADRLRRTFNITKSDSCPSSLACDRFAVDVSLGSQILLPRTIEPDEPTETPNQPQLATEEPPPLHLSYLKPIVSDSINDDEDSDDQGSDSFNYNINSYNDRRRNRNKKNKKKLSLNGRGARLLLAEWHIGSDPRSYTWKNPYEGEKEKDDPYSQFSQSQSSQRKGKGKKRNQKDEGFLKASNSSSQSVPPQFSQSRFEFPSSFPAAADISSSSQTYFPSFGVAAAAATSTSSLATRRLNTVSEEVFRHPPESSSQDYNSLGPQTQPVISVTGPAEPATRGGGSGGLFNGANSQIVPGVFGSRNGLGGRGKEKKKTKKRVSGF